MKYIRQITPAVQATFLEVVRETGNIHLAAQKVGFSRNSLYRARDRDPAFAEAWQDAWDSYVAILEAECDRRAVQGYVKQVIVEKDGKRTEIRAYSDNLLMFRLKALKPEQYRDWYKTEGINPQVLQVIVQKVLVYLSDEQATELLKFVEQELPAGRTICLEGPVVTEADEGATAAEGDGDGAHASRRNGA